MHTIYIHPDTKILFNSGFLKIDNGVLNCNRFLFYVTTRNGAALKIQFEGADDALLEIVAEASQKARLYKITEWLDDHFVRSGGCLYVSDPSS